MVLTNLQFFNTILLEEMTAKMQLNKLPASLGLALLLALLLLAVRPWPATEAEPVVIWGGPPTVKQVALTFDDGPSPHYTPEIMMVLHHYRAQATFFVLGEKVEKYPYLVHALLGAGHEVGNHTFDHQRLTKIADPGRENEVERTAVDLDLLGDRTSRWIRPPFGSFDEHFQAYVAHTHGRIVLWSIDSGDWRGLGRDTIVKNVVNRVRPGAIVIFHDSDETGKVDRRPTVEALKLIVPALQRMGYRLVTISQLVAGDSAPRPAVVQVAPHPAVKPRLDFGGSQIKSGSL